MTSLMTSLMTSDCPSHQVELIDLSKAGFPIEGGEGLGAYQPMHRYAVAVVGAILSANMTVKRLKLNPGGATEGGAVLEHIHRARKSTLAILDVTGIELGDRGGANFFESFSLAGKSSFLSSLHLGSNKLTDQAVGPLLVETLRSDG